MSVERRGPAVCNFSGNQGGKDEMTKASNDLQDLRRRIYVKAKAETTWRFWGLYVHVCKMETLRAGRKERWGSGSRWGDLRGHRNARRRCFPRTDCGRTQSAHICTTPGPKAGNTEGRG